MNAIQVQNLSKTYKNGVQALSNLDLTVKPGEIFSLLGQNGAGKSTLIHILITFLKPTSGSVTIFGKDILKNPEFIRLNIACVAQQTSIDTHLSLEENMLFQGRLYNVPKAEAKKRMDLLIEEFDLKHYLKYPVVSYSGGIKRRLDIAMNMMSNPKILFLDEPTVGMDIQSRMAMWNMVKKIRDNFGTTIFLTTHYLEEADNLSDTICIMRNGREAIQGTPSELKCYLRQENIEIRFATKEDANAARKLLTKTYYEHRIVLENTTITITTNDSAKDFRTFISFLLDNQILFRGIEISQPTLESIFVRLTEKEAIE